MQCKSTERHDAKQQIILPINSVTKVPAQQNPFLFELCVSTPPSRHCEAIQSPVSWVILQGLRWQRGRGKGLDGQVRNVLAFRCPEPLLPRS